MTLFGEREEKPQARTKTFSERVLELALSIPRGKVATYGAIARAAGGGSIAAQSITGVLGKAYDKGNKKIPFHRIVYSDGRIWVNPRYRKERLALYKKEKIQIEDDRIVDFRDKLFEF